MIEIDNRTGWPHASLLRTGPGGETFDVVAVKGTFDFAPPGRRVTPAADPAPIAWGDQYDGPVEDDPLKAVLFREGELALYKPGTDVYLTGTAHARDDKPSTGWLAGFGIGPVKKVLQLHGPRRFRRSLLGWRLTSAEPAATVALDYRLAFGGSFVVPGEAASDAPPSSIYKADNPAGCGWLPDAAMLKAVSRPARRALASILGSVRELPAPQIEHPLRPVTHPHKRHAAEGFAPLARWCSPRLRHAGTYDERWQAERHPWLPEDFDTAFYQSAHPDLICKPYLCGEEVFTMAGLLHEGMVSQRLPGQYILAAMTFSSGKKQAGRLVLDTVGIDLDARRVMLVWRGTFERNDPLRALALGLATAPAQDATLARSAHV